MNIKKNNCNIQWRPPPPHIPYYPPIISNVRMCVWWDHSVYLNFLHYSESSINRCEGLLFADATTSGRGLAEMSMTPRPISNSVKQLQNVIKKMEGVILNVMNDLRQKEKVGVLGDNDYLFFTCVVRWSRALGYRSGGPAFKPTIKHRNYML